MPRDDLPPLTLYYVASCASFPTRAAFLQHLQTVLSTNLVSALQLREKKLSTEEFTDLAREVQKVTKKYSVPLFINDNVEVCKAVEAEGLHIGWKDTALKAAREALPPNTFIGLSASNLEQALSCADQGADYIGLGPIYPTPSKPDHNPPIYPSGAADILKELGKRKDAPPVVLIGGINEGNLQAVKYRVGGYGPGPEDEDKNDAAKRLLSGIAVISAISASPDPAHAVRQLHSLYTQPPHFLLSRVYGRSRTVSAVLSAAPHILAQVARKKPLVHHMTNTVVQTLSANVTLAAGASPIMSTAVEEIEELSGVNGALVLNIGTLQGSTKELFLKALKESNQRAVPVVFDPVGVGASNLRKETAKAVLESGYISILKGNEAELAALSGSTLPGSKGVDSSSSTGTESSRISLVKTLARRYRNIVVMTGRTDIVSDSNVTYLLENGHHFQSLTTGAGCALASMIASAVAVADDALNATVAAICAYNIAAQLAGQHNEACKGPGTFVPAWLDEIWKLRCASVEGVDGWVGFTRARREGEEQKLKGSLEMRLMS